MAKFDKAGGAAGAILLLLAAFFSIALILQPLDFGAYGPGRSNFLFTLGHMLVSVYGFCSVLIPVFLFVSAVVCIAGNLTARSAARMLTAVVPFFTAVVTENICKSIVSLGGDAFPGIKIGITVGLGAMLVVIEFLGAGIIADRITDKTKTEEQVFPEEPEPADEEMPVGEDEAYKENILPHSERNAFEHIFDYDKGSDGKSGLKTETEDSDDNSNPASVITDEEYHALTSGTDSGTEDGAEIEELEWPDTAVQHAPKDDAFSDAEFIESFSDAQQKKIDGTVRGEETAVTDTTEAKTDDNGTLDPDFFDIDMNAETEDEKENDIALSHIAPDTLTAFAEKNLPQQDSASEASAAAAPSIAIAEDVFAEMDKDVRRNLPLKNEEAVQDSAYSGESAEDISVKTETANEEQEQVSGTQQEEETHPITDVPRIETPAEKPQAEKKIIKIKGPYKIPTTLLTAYEDDQYWIIDEETRNASVQLKETLNEFNIEADVTGIKKGPVVTMFEILPAPGVKLSKIAALQDNIALRLAASSVRIVAPIPGKRAVGIEIPNKERSIVSFREIIEQDLPEFKKMAVPVILGKDILGKPQLLDLVKTPHLLIAGSTGSGKSVCVNSIILSILYKRSPEEVKLILIDPKIVELKLYNDIPHLLVPVITEPKKAFQALQWSLCEMERRYALLDGMGSRDISNYNKKIEEKHIATEKLPYIVIIIDEFADLMATTGKELESTVARLAAMSRAVGLHLVLATQRPSIDVITGLIKANIPTRIAFMVASKMDSRIIIDQVGAEKLLGKGDMLYSSAVDPFPVRIQGTFVSDQEVENVVEYVKKFGEPEYIDEEVFVADDEDESVEPSLFSDGEDPLYSQALDIVVQAGKASASYIQRRLKIGYNRAARLVEEMEDRGIVGPANGSKPREIIHVP
ncbi:MAG TPA: cell division protein FtsK [Treponema sp.]|nr:cell division protein FtsK [Treponema sp.]